jgi:hypothetical protein
VRKQGDEAMNWLVFTSLVQAEETTPVEKSTVAAFDSVWTSGTTIGKGSIATEVSFKHHSYTFEVRDDVYQRLKSQYPYTLTRYGLFKNTEIQLHLAIGQDCFYASEGNTPKCYFGDTISFTDGEKFVGVGFKQSLNMGPYLTAYVYTHKDLKDIDDYYGGVGLQVNAGTLTSSLHTPSEYKKIEHDSSIYGNDEDFSGYSAIVQLESANRIEILQSSEKIPVQIDLLAAYSIPLHLRHTTIEKIIKYEGMSADSQDEIGFVYLSNKRSYKGGLGFYLEDYGIYISTSMYSHLYFEINSVVTKEDFDRSRSLNYNEFITKNNGFHLVVSKTW